MLYFLLSVIYLAAYINQIAGTIHIRKFLARVPAIANRSDLEAFKTMVRRQMKMAALQLALLVPAGLLCFIGFFTGRVHLLFIAAINIPMIILGSSAYRREYRAKTLRVADPLNMNEYRTVCELWRKSIWPRF